MRSLDTKNEKKYFIFVQKTNRRLFSCIVAIIYCSIILVRHYILIKEFYKKGIDKEDLEMFDSLFLDYQDLTFYVESKNKREDATYSSKRFYEKSVVENLRIKAVLFVNKVKGMIENI